MDHGGESIGSRRRVDWITATSRLDHDGARTAGWLCAGIQEAACCGGIAPQAQKAVWAGGSDVTANLAVAEAGGAGEEGGVGAVAALARQHLPPPTLTPPRPLAPPRSSDPYVSRYRCPARGRAVCKPRGGVHGHAERRGQDGFDCAARARASWAGSRQAQHWRCRPSGTCGAGRSTG